jgi:hypothetical protein
MDVDKCFMDYLQSMKRKSSEDAGELFLLSFLPDISELSMRQRRIFKKSLSDLIDSISDEGEPRSASGCLSSVPSTSFTADDYTTSLLARS